ncbi:MAG: glycosyltransferase family 9 protein [Oligoflexia bacterium]
MSVGFLIRLSARPRILVVRADRLGDVVLSLPTIEVLKRAYPHSHLCVWVQPRVAPLLRGLPFIDEVQEIDPAQIGILELRKRLRAGRWELALLLQAQFKIAAALWLTRVRFRVGPFSKLYSYLFFNFGLRQRRSQVEMHEADYNLQLLQLLGIEVGSRSVIPRVIPGNPAKARVEIFLRDAGVGQARPWVAVHPGMGGSALNWPDSHYEALVLELLTSGVGVVVTGGPGEQAILDRMVSKFASRFSASFAVFGGSKAGSVDELAALYSKMAVVVAPSTGPLHVAAAVGARVVSFYPPIRVQSARRWGPYVEEIPGFEHESRASVLVPEVHCGQDFKCRGPACRYFPCMSSLTVAQVRDLVQNHLKQSQKHS